MKAKSFLVVVALIVVLGLIAWGLQSQRTASLRSNTARIDKPLVENLPLQEIKRVVLKENATTVHLVVTNNAWAVQELSHYRGDASKINDMLTKLWNSKVIQAPRIDPKYFGKMNLLPPGQGEGSGKFIEVQDATGKSLATVIVGREVSLRSADGGPSFPQGRHVRVLSTPDDVLVVKELFTDVDVVADRWIAKDFVTVTDVKSVRMEPSGTNAGWAVQRDSLTNQFQLLELAEGETADVGAVESAGSGLANPTFESIASTNLSAAELGLDPPQRVATVTTFDGFKYVFRIGAKQDDGKIPAQVDVEANLVTERKAPEGESEEDKKKADEAFEKKLADLRKKLQKEEQLEGWTFLFYEGTLSSLTKPRSELLKKPDAAPEAEPAAAAPPMDFEAIPGS